jgi:hypothetical protein
MRHPYTGATHHSPVGIAGCFRSHISRLMEEPPQDELAHASIESGTFQWPFGKVHAPNHFVLQSPATLNSQQENLLCMMQDKQRFLTAVRMLSNGKQPGPDGIPNELIKHLPDDWHTLIHNVFILMWVLGKCPSSWKLSHTIMLYRKGDPTFPGNYRPIGLSQTIGKLWTKVITSILCDYASHHTILSHAQEGCLKHRGTMRQARNLINCIEDGALTKQDLYVTCIDVSSAFNVINHTLLLGIMARLGFPDDASTAVKSIYTNSVTCIRNTNGVLSKPIQINRGTKQGDSLSPFLFLVYIEPLLRWLNCGARGYQHGCLQVPHYSRCSLQHAASAKAYVDDIAIFAHTVEDMRKQIHKLDLWSAHACIKVNASKCAVAGILHGSCAQGICASAVDNKQLTRFYTKHFK